ncbi:MAG: c-type cytochrome [Candidatus Eisenbacteria bacterium]
MRGTRRWGAAVVALAGALAVVGLGRDTTQGAENAAGAVDTAAMIASDNHRIVAELRSKIAGRENAPADSVFDNIKMFKGVPASRMLSIMEMGFARSLGVKCEHCHVAGKWASEDKKQKQVARDMAAMVRAINDTLLTRIPNLEGPHPTVNCTTCHRGQVKPALNLAAAGPAPGAPPPGH